MGLGTEAEEVMDRNVTYFGSSVGLYGCKLNFQCQSWKQRVGEKIFFFFILDITTPQCQSKVAFLLDAMLPIKQFEVGMLTDMPKSKYGLSNAFKVTVTSQQLFKGG